MLEKGSKSVNEKVVEGLELVVLEVFKKGITTRVLLLLWERRTAAGEDYQGCETVGEGWRKSGRLQIDTFTVTVDSLQGQRPINWKGEYVQKWELTLDCGWFTFTKIVCFSEKLNCWRVSVTCSYVEERWDRISVWETQIREQRY